MPVTAGLIGLQAVGGLTQALTSGKNARQKELEAYAKQSPFYKPSKTIQDYYQESLNRYRENPYQSAQYQAGQQGIQRGMATALNNLQGWGASVAGATKLAQSQADALSRLGAGIESQKGQRLNQLGQAAGAQTAEQARAFDINQMTPYNRMLQLKQMKAQAAADQYNAGLQMLGSAASNAAYAGQSGIFKDLFKGGAGTDAVTQATNLTPLNTNIPGTPFGKFNAPNFAKYGINNTGFKTILGKTIPTLNLGGSLPSTNQSAYNIDSDYFNPNY